MYLGDMDFLVAQMIHFVEDLPDEWRPQWEEMQKSTGRIRDDIPGMASFSHLFRGLDLTHKLSQTE